MDNKRLTAQEANALIDRTCGFTKKQQFNVRLPGYTAEQIELIQQTYGLTQVQVIILAIDRLTRDLNPESGDDIAIVEAEGLAAGEEAAKTIYHE